MDPDLIRLILVVLGVLLVIGIYAWDRIKRLSPPRRMGRRAPSSMSLDDIGEQRGERREPRVESQPESVPAMAIDDVASDESISDGDPRDAIAERPRQVRESPAWQPDSTAADPQFTMDLSFDAHGDSDYLSIDPALLDEVERKLIVFNVVAGSSHFGGAAIAKACAACGLVAGEMDIYHYQDPRSGKVLFSLASMVEPGTFPWTDMKAFSTPGLSMFTQLPGARDGVEIFDTMLKAARQLASLLQGEVQDERHNKLTGQMEKHLRESVVEHRRRLRLLRGRR